jgi:hypothetical protein
MLPVDPSISSARIAPTRISWPIHATRLQVDVARTSEPAYHRCGGVVVFRALHRRCGPAALAMFLVGCNATGEPGTDPDYDGDGISNFQEFFGG